MIASLLVDTLTAIVDHAVRQRLTAWGPLGPELADEPPGILNTTWGDLDCGRRDQYGKWCLHRYRHRGRCLFPLPPVPCDGCCQPDQCRAAGKCAAPSAMEER